MPVQIDDQVVEFFDKLFERVFSLRFGPAITQPRRRRAVVRQVQEAADAASQSLNRFFLNVQLSELHVSRILGGLATLGDNLNLEEIANPNLSPEAIADRLLKELPCPESVRSVGHDAIYLVALHSVVQVLLRVGPVMVE